MKLALFLLFSFSFFLEAREIPLNSSKVCQKCHPLIYKEFKASMHAKASIFNDPVHKVIWEGHPAKKNKNYKCKKCHTPVDTQLKGLPKPNEIQLHEPISCVYCHRIKSIEEHAKSNINVLDKRGDTLFGARESQKGEKDVEFGVKSSFFGLVTKEHGSPFHKIDFSNENFYNGKLCMGCHSHKQNAHGFNVCKMDAPLDEKQNCITCHMPKVKGSFSTIKKTPTHRFHGFAGVSSNPELLSKYVDLKLRQNKNGWYIEVHNKASHELFLHPMRLGELRIYRERDGKRELLKTERFFKILGSNNKPSPPWVATQVLKNMHLKADETRSYVIDGLHKGDHIEVVLGYYKVNPKIAKKLGLNEKEVSRFRVLKRINQEIR